ncbi:MAG: tetratricopeptide (TPR) repeat protein [Myxococcota bacterium]
MRAVLALLLLAGCGPVESGEAGMGEPAPRDASEPAPVAREEDVLPDDVTEAMETAGALGDQLADLGQHEAAIAAYREGLDLLPEPRGRWAAAAWFHAAIGEAQWLSRDLEGARTTWMLALLEGGLGNPFIHLRRGQTLLELNDPKEAANELLKALLLEGVGIFDGEDPKYFAAVVAVAKPPDGRDSWDGFKGLPAAHPVLAALLDPAVYTLRKS